MRIALFTLLIGLSAVSNANAESNCTQKETAECNCSFGHPGGTCSHNTYGSGNHCREVTGGGLGTYACPGSAIRSRSGANNNTNTQ